MGVMDKAKILEMLTDWNFWKAELETGIPRDGVTKSVGSAAQAKEIVVVKGIRRCGKSTILLQYFKHLFETGVRKEDTLVVNCEDPRIVRPDLDLLNRIYEVYLTELLPNKQQYVLLDEVQVVPGWEKFARFLREVKGAGVFVTGSSSKLLSSEYGTVLAGRHIDIEMEPLSFREYLRFKGVVVGSGLDRAAERHRIQSALKDYIRWGGFPKIALLSTEAERRGLLDSYFRDIIIKDITLRYKVKKIEKLEELAKYYLTNISNHQSFNRIKHALRLNLDTVERFSSYMEAVYLLFFVRKFSYSKKEQLLNPRKVYCADTGMRNTVAFVFSEDAGRLAENVVFTHLHKGGAEIYYWKGQKEVDFIVKKGARVCEAIQVCWDVRNEKTKERELKGLCEACKALSLKNGVVITEDFAGQETVEGVTVIYKPLWRWLLEDSPAT